MFMKQTMNVLKSNKMRRHAVRNAALSAAVPMGFLAAMMTGTAAKAAQTSATAFDNGTMQPAGPRSGTNGKIFFNLEGDSNGANASYGVVDFSGSDFGTPMATNINSLTLSFVEGNSAFTAPGGVEVYL